MFVQNLNFWILNALTLTIMPALVTLTMQAQIEERAERSWKLRDMLHLGKLNVPGSAMDDDGYLMKTSAPPMQPTLVTRPTLVGKSNFSVVEVVSGKWVSTGMPNRKQKGPKNQKWLTKAIVRDKNSGVITWQEPLVYSPSLKLTLVNKQLSKKDPRRLVLQTLRAMDRFHGKPAYDKKHKGRDRARRRNKSLLLCAVRGVFSG